MLEGCAFCKQIYMLMNVLASGFLFLFIGPFKHVSSGEIKEAGVSISPVKEVYIAVNDTLELNCSINATIQDIHPTQLGWKHNARTLINFTRVVNNNTIQLRKNHTQYEDAGVYECGLFNSSKFQSAQKIMVLVGEKPRSISEEQFNVKVYGKPVREVTVEWPALQANVTNELFVGRVPVGDCFCEFSSTAQCRRTAGFQNETLSCYIGMDVLGKLFQRNELFNGGCSAHSFCRCDIFCAKVLVENSFGARESGPAHWNLLMKTRCPPLRNLTVLLGEHNLTASWQRPPLVAEDEPVRYIVTYTITPLLTGKALRPQSFMDRPNGCTKCVWPVQTIKPYAKYIFTVACSFDMDFGPAVSTEVTSKEAAPSDAPPSCEVEKRSRHEAFVSWKVPSIDTWNGKPEKFLVYYGDQRVVVNTSLTELQILHNRSTTPRTMLKNLDPHKNYTFRVAMCTVGGCGEPSEACFVRNFTEGGSNTKVPSPDETNHTGVITWLAIVTGVAAGLILVVLIACFMGLKRSRRKQRPPLASVCPLNGIYPYENLLDDGPSLCEDVQYYESIGAIRHRPLLPDMDGAVGNLPVTEI